MSYCGSAIGQGRPTGRPASWSHDSRVHGGVIERIDAAVQVAIARRAARNRYHVNRPKTPLKRGDVGQVQVAVVVKIEIAAKQARPLLGTTGLTG